MRNNIKILLGKFLRLPKIYSEELEDYIENSKGIVLFTLVLISFLMMIFFGISSYKSQVYDIAIINVFNIIFYIILIYFLRKSSKIDILAFFYFVFLGSYFLYFMAYGGISKSGFIWTFLYPLATLFFFGRKKGLWFSLLFLLIATVFLFTFSVYRESGLPFQLRYIALYSAIIIVSYAFEETRDRLTKAVSEKNLALREKIVELEQKDKALTEAKEKAENADKLKSEFLAQMSHEIRTPVNTILNYSSLVEEEFKDHLSSDIDYSFGAIKKASTRLIRTIDMILNLSTIESGSYIPYFEKLSLYSDIILPLAEEFDQSAKAKNLHLIVCNSIETEPLLSIDKYTLTQAVANLIDNAIKYTNNGSIRVHTNYDEKNCNILIEDTGVGISKKYLPELFNKFTQETSGYTRRYDGNGLGLALVKKYCEINNGSISVESEQGKGTTFKIKIPYK